MSNKPCLALLIDAPMQSWGFTSRFTRRTTALFPTKSGIIGILAAALGVDKRAAEESDLIRRFVELQCTVVSVPRKGPKDRELPVLRLVDYHTVGGGYDKKVDPLKVPRSASGSSFGTVVSERHFLLDARFVALLEGERAWLETLAGALQNPRWGVWFGRKCCLPASPLLVGIGENRTDAFRAALQRIGIEQDYSIGHFDHVVEGDEADGVDSEWLDDLPVAFGAAIGERHVPRRIRTVHRQQNG